MNDDLKGIATNTTNTIINNSISVLAQSSTGVLIPNFWFIGSFRLLLTHSIKHQNLYSENEKQNIIELYIKQTML